MADSATSWVDALQRYVEGLVVTTMAAAEEATAVFHRRVVERAEQTPGWDQIASNIELWSQDGHLVIGVADLDMAAQAELLEYGDQDQDPNPLFRTLTNELRDANQSAQSEFDRFYGPSMDVGAIRIKGMSYGR